MSIVRIICIPMNIESGIKRQVEAVWTERFFSERHWNK
jgi:hypothetical protein